MSVSLSICLSQSMSVSLFITLSRLCLLVCHTVLLCFSVFQSIYHSPSPVSLSICLSQSSICLSVYVCQSLSIRLVCQSHTVSLSLSFSLSFTLSYSLTPSLCLSLSISLNQSQSDSCLPVSVTLSVGPVSVCQFISSASVSPSISLYLVSVG